MLDAIEAQASLPTPVAEPPLASDEALLVRVARLLQDQGTPTSRDQIVSAAARLDEANTPLGNGAPIPDTLPVSAASVFASRTLSSTEDLSAWTRWRVNFWLRASHWFAFRAQRLAPTVDLFAQGLLDEGMISAKERHALAAMRDAAQRQLPLIPDDAEHRWVKTLWEVRQRRSERGGFKPLSKGDALALNQTAPRDHDPLVSGSYEKSAFTERQWTAIGDILYGAFNRPEHSELAYDIDWPLLKHLVACGINPDVKHGRIWTGLDHPPQSGWTARQTCAYFHVTQALDILSPIAPPVPAKEKDSLLWWATEAHYTIDYPIYWGYWATHPKAWGERFKASVCCILDHEPAPLFHARLLRKAMARAHPMASWIGEEMARRGWPAG
jgi:hypothetical protein